MNVSKVTAIVRYVATIVIGALAAVASTYPNMTWIPVAIGVLGTLGVNVIPTGGQSTPAVTAVKSNDVIEGPSK